MKSLLKRLVGPQPKAENRTWVDSARLAELEGKLGALDKSLAVIEFALDGTILAANENFCAALGYAESEIKGQHHRLFVDPAERQSPAYRAFWERLANGQFDKGEYRRIGKAGREVWIQATYNPIRDADGRPFKVVKYATDVSEQVRLRQISAQLSMVANETDNSVIITDAAGVIEYVNTGFFKLTGLSAEEAIGRKPGELLQGPRTDPEARKRIREKLEAQVPFYEEILNYNRNGESYWISLAINPVFDANHRLKNFVSIQTNITDVKLQQIDYNTRLEAISRSTAIIEFTPAGEILTANENFCRTMGYPLSELQGRHHRMFAEAEFANSADYRTLWEKLGRGEYDAGVYKRVANGGRIVWLQANYNPVFDQDGRVTKVIKFAIDITEQHLSAEKQAELVRETSEVMGALAGGALTQLMEGEYVGDFALLKESINESIMNLRNMVTQIGDAARSISTSSSEIAVGNQDLSQRTEEQASSLQQTATSMEELSSTVQKNADNARQASELAAGTRRQAETGGKVAANAIAAMGEINQSSKRIAEIIGVIDEIAFQTNLLALNAAVEAARAGEQGRGFAVVASEVRNLAQRSAAAAKEIKGLIKDSESKVEEGSRLVNESGDALGEIVQSTRKVSEIITEIASASEEQAAGIAQVNKAVMQMEQVVQQNAALVEEAAAASESMNEQARGLTGLVGFFKVADNQIDVTPRGRSGAERRGAERPWSKPHESAPRVSADPVKFAQAAGSDWNEF